MRFSFALVFPIVSLALGGCAISYPQLSFAVEQRLLRETTLDDLPEGHAETGDAVVRIITTGRSAGMCSGALVGPRHVLTAQHCVMKLDALRELTMTTLPAGAMHVELGGDYLPWGRVGVREVFPCDGYEHDVDHDIALLILSKPVPASVPIFELAYDIPTEAGVFELAGFGTNTNARTIPGTAWPVLSVTRHLHRGPVISTTDGAIRVQLPGAPGDSGGPIVDVGTGRIAGVVSRGRTSDDRDRDGPLVVGARLMRCKKTIATALAR